MMMLNLINSITASRDNSNAIRYLAIIFKFKSTASIGQIRCSWRRLAKIFPPAVNGKSKFFEQARWVLHSDETSLDLPMLSQLILVKCHCGLFGDEHLI